MKTEWIHKCQHWKKTWPIFQESFIDDSNGINLYKFIEELNSIMTEKETIVCDAGSAIYVPCQNLKLKEGQDFILSGAQADMGFAVPASVGVYLANTSKNVLVVTGDGSFNTNIQELATIKNLNIPIKIFVWNNNGYLSIRNTQDKFYGGRVYGTDSSNGLWVPELSEIASTYKFEFYKLDNNKTLNEKLPEILSLDKPTICEILCKADQSIVPTLALKKDQKTGENIQCGLDDLYPFLPEEELQKEKF